MKLNTINILNLRNIKQAKLEFHPEVNLISGPNGAGKTSFLEAIYLLSTGHSFRSRQTDYFISHDRDQVNVFAKTNNNDIISIQKSNTTNTEARINKQPCNSSSMLAAFLPSLLFYQDIFQFIDSGAVLRRTFLDWGLFHVEHSYFGFIKDYRRVLKQRNSLLKTSPSPSYLAPWNLLLAELAEKIHLLREKYYQRLEPLFKQISYDLTNLDCSLHYYKGWDKKNEGRALTEILESSYQRDCVRQSTHYGAHQADLWVVSEDHKARHYLSRGQQKAILFALKFAQAQFLSQPCLLLIDDLIAELDEEKIAAILNYLPKLGSQSFITARPKDLEFVKSYFQSYQSFSISNGELELECGYN